MRYVCAVNGCQVTCSNAGNMKRHRETMHEGKCYQCAFCQRLLRRKDHLARHIRSVHTDVNPSGILKKLQCHLRTGIDLSPKKNPWEMISCSMKTDNF